MENKKKYVSPSLKKQGTIQDLTKGEKQLASPSDGWTLAGDDLSTVVS